MSNTLKRLTVRSAITVVLLLSAGQVAAQEFRGIISGRALDPTESVVPGAQITVTNVETNVSTTTTSNEEGNYTVPYLKPGIYTVIAEANGYKKLFRSRIEVRVGDRVSLDLQLELGAVEETVTVEGNSTPLLDANSANTGQVIDERRIRDLPLLDGNVFGLLSVAPGVSYLADRNGTTGQGGNGTMSDFRTNGNTTQSNEFTIDGAPNVGTSRRVAYVPSADSVQEFKISTSSFEAVQGRTAGATVDVVLKSGTNNYHGTLFEFIRNDVLNSNNFGNKATIDARTGQSLPRRGRRYNRFGGTIGGPVLLPSFGQGGPSIWNGRNKTFFFVNYERIVDRSPAFSNNTVPTDRLRNSLRAGTGADFSEYLGAPITVTLAANGCAGRGGQVVNVLNTDGTTARVGQIYNPLSAVRIQNYCNPLTNRVEARTIRQPFAGNIIPASLISPIGVGFINALYPSPNQTRLENNYVANSLNYEDYYGMSYRVDHTFSEANRGFFRVVRGRRDNINADNFPGFVNGIRPTGNQTIRISNSYAYDHVTTISPTTFLNVRASYTRFTDTDLTPSVGVFDPATLGFSANTVAQFGGARYLPNFSLTGNSFTGPQSNRGLGERRVPEIYVLQPTMTKVMGQHTLRFGYDFRRNVEHEQRPQHLAGSYSFDTTFTRRTDEAGSVPRNLGLDLAALLLGQPTGGFISRNTTRSNVLAYHSQFFQDDWRVTRNLTLNLGLRYEYESAPIERYNRNIVGFDTTAVSPIEAQVKAAYAAAYQAAPANFPLTPDQLRVRGALTFASDDNRRFFETDRNNVQPRIGAAYQLNDRTVLRGGWGIYANPIGALSGGDSGFFAGLNQLGFSQDVGIISTTNSVEAVTVGIGGTDPTLSTLANPFPNGIPQPPGTSFGALSGYGRGLGNIAPSKVLNSQLQRWMFGVQHELPGQIIVEANYIGSRSYDLPLIRNINALPSQYLSTSRQRDNAVISFLNGSIPNPFRVSATQSLIPDRSVALATSASIGYTQILRPFPQFGDINTFGFDGRSSYHSGQFRLERRLTKGFSIQASYTWSKLMEETSYLNPTDVSPEKRISPNDIPHVLATTGIWELPIGKGRWIGNGWNGLADGVLGGWELTGFFILRSGTPIGLGNRYYNGDPFSLRTVITGDTADISGLDRSRLGFDTSGFYFTDAQVQTNGVIDPAKQRADQRINLSQNIRYFPSTLPGFRNDRSNVLNLSLIKYVGLSETVRLQLRADFTNVFNTPILNNPGTDPLNINFAKINSASGEGDREGQLGIKLIF